MKRPISTDIYLIFSDIHHPEYSKPSFKAALSFMERNQSRIKGVVLLGDNMDCVNFSRHTKGKPRLRTRGGIAKDFDRFDNDILIPIEKRLEKNTRKWFFLGNHEDWLEQWLDENPEFEDTVSFDKCLNLTRRGWDVVKQGEYRRLGKAYLVHGDDIGSGPNVARKLVESFCATVVMGHVHSASMYTKVSQVKSKDKWIGYTLPTLGTVSPKYAKGRPNAWIQGFGILEKWPNGFVNIYVPVIFNGCFSFGGQLYSRDE